MKKQTLLAALFIALGIAASAQTITNQKLAGKWIVTSAIINDMSITAVSDLEQWKSAMYQNDLKKEPGKVFSQEDSMGIEFAAELMMGIVGEMNIVFHEDGKFGRIVDQTKVGKGISEKLSGTYEIKKGKIAFKEGGDDAESDAIMPNDNTLVLADFVQKGLTLTFTRQ